MCCQKDVPPAGHRLFGFFATTDPPKQPDDGGDNEAWEAYYEALGKYYGEYKATYVSRWALGQMYDAVIKSELAKLKKFGELANGAVKGMLFERTVHKLFTYATNSEDQTVTLKMRGGATVDFRSKGVVVFDTLDMVRSKDTYYMPSKPNQAGFDSVLSGQGFFRMTIKETHSLDAGFDDMEQIADQCAEWTSPVKVPFYWIVPAGTRFTTPKLSTAGKRQKPGSAPFCTRLEQVVLEVEVESVLTKFSNMREALYGDDA